MNATVLTQLTAGKAMEQDFNATGVCQTIHHTPARGINRQISLGPMGITIVRGKVAVAIPIAELLAIADKAEPRLSAPPPSRTAKPASNPKTSMTGAPAVKSPISNVKSPSAPAQQPTPQTNQSPPKQ